MGALYTQKYELHQFGLPLLINPFIDSLLPRNIPDSTRICWEPSSGHPFEPRSYEWSNNKDELYEDNHMWDIRAPIEGSYVARVATILPKLQPHARSRERPIRVNSGPV